MSFHVLTDPPSTMHFFTFWSSKTDWGIALGLSLGLQLNNLKYRTVFIVFPTIVIFCYDFQIDLKRN